MYKSKILDPKNFNYERNVKAVLNETEEPMSVKDIRKELTDHLGGFELTEQYGEDDIQRDIEEALESIEQKDSNQELDGSLIRRSAIYNADNPTELESQEIQYSII